jgi:hypothetical protein
MAYSRVVFDNPDVFPKDRVGSGAGKSGGVLPKHVFKGEATAGAGQEGSFAEAVQILEPIFGGRCGEERDALGLDRGALQ